MKKLLENMPAVVNLIRNEKFNDESGTFPSYNQRSVAEMYKDKFMGNNGQDTVRFDV